MNIKVLNFEGNKSETLKVSDNLMGLKANNRLLKYVIDWQLNHSKKRLAKTKQRNEVIGSTRKIYAQKGTGGARHSSRKAPIFISPIHFKEEYEQRALYFSRHKKRNKENKNF